VFFCENSNAEQAKLKKFYILILILLIGKDATFLTLTSWSGKFKQVNMYRTLSELALFCNSYDKNILVCFFRFTVYLSVFSYS